MLNKNHITLHIFDNMRNKNGKNVDFVQQCVVFELSYDKLVIDLPLTDSTIPKNSDNIC